MIIEKENPFDVAEQLADALAYCVFLLENISEGKTPAESSFEAANVAGRSALMSFWKACAEAEISEP